MSPAFLLKGLAIGFSIAAPVGPIGILCIRRSLRDGMAAGLATGLGAATADAAYGAVAGFGLTAVSGFLVGQRHWIGLLGGAFLCYLGVRTLMSGPVAESAPGPRASLAAAYASTLFLTLANPATILSFVVIFAAFGLGTRADYGAASSLVAGVFLGSTLWWLFLSGGVGMVRSRVNPAWMRAINSVSGAVLLAFGAYALLRS
jgi:threonine/homoserine/homoserine lactone efflux protein